jgi:hypothetical protein
MQGYGLHKYMPYSNHPPTMANSLTRRCTSISFALYVIRKLRLTCIGLPIQRVTNSVLHLSLVLKIFCKPIV